MMIIVALLIKFTYLLKIHMMQNINILSKNVKKKKKNGLENLKDFNTFTEYSNNIQDVYKSFEDFNPIRKCIYRIC